ncbi:isochorismatase family protein [Nocardiopsis algeriensis]|uniref:Ureidoacrylate peracid hydrolase n=1 Tax=Nocardiopsis algeriensis TaxID=1478215 RepID=A0A841J034_9ACTN|nr:ureidoacrylate peracid hydrolase [Nocardiopsis algeriensis]
MTEHISDVTGRPRPVPGPPGEAALVVVDVQRDFADPAHLPWLSPADRDRVLAAVERTADLVGRARAAGVPVVWVRLEQDLAEPWGSSRWHRGLLDADPDTLLSREPCVAGTSGAEWFGVEPEPEEPVVAKRRYSGFHGTDLERVLHGIGATWVTVCGLTADCCVDSTARDAFQLGFRVVVAADATASYEEDRHSSAMRALALHAAVVAGSEETAAAWTAPSSDRG